MYKKPMEGVSFLPDLFKKIAGSTPQAEVAIKCDTYSEAYKILAEGKGRIDTKYICIGANKGGVGKSTICVQLAWFLHHKGFKVLIVDLDPQATLTKWHTEKKYRKKKGADLSLYEVLEGSCEPKDPIVEIENGFDLYTGNWNLDTIDALLEDKELIEDGTSDLNFFQKRKILRRTGDYYKNAKKIFDKIGSDYDIVLFDTNPVCDRLNRLSLQQTDLCLFPVGDYDSSEFSFEVMIDELGDSLRSIGENSKANNLPSISKVFFNEICAVADDGFEDALNNIRSVYHVHTMKSFVPSDYYLGKDTEKCIPAFSSEYVGEETIDCINKLTNEVIELLTGVEKTSNAPKRRVLRRPSLRAEGV